MIMIVGLCLCLGWSDSSAQGQTRTQGSPPVITKSFAAGRVGRGKEWRIYLEASDPDGDMRYFVWVVDQVGYGKYPTDQIAIRKQYRKELKGYLRAFIQARRRGGVPEWTQLNLTLYIRERGRNTSNKVTFPVVCSQSAKEEPPPPPFDSGQVERVGTIAVELTEGVEPRRR